MAATRDKITAIDAHVAGEPLRVVLGGFPEVYGTTMLEKRRYASECYDRLRTLLVWEPRGHADMYGCLITPPVSMEADLGVLFFHNAGFSTMCGHGVIGLVTVALETGIIKTGDGIRPVCIDTPSGTVSARAAVDGGRVRHVAFRNVPSFAMARDQTVEVPGLGQVRYDVAFGGAFYAICQVDELGVDLVPRELQRLREWGMAIKQAVMRQCPIRHPLQNELGLLYGTIFVGPPQQHGVHSRNVCIFADGAVDRSPTGTGISARLALAHARGEMDVGHARVIESIIGSRFTGRVAGRLNIGIPAIIPEIEGTAYLTGRHES